MTQDASSSQLLPGWFTGVRSAVFGLYFGIMALCVAGIFVIGFGGMILMRDFSSYSLSGNPWEPSDLPWHVIWPMRLMSIVGVMFVVAIGFTAGNAAILRLGGGKASAGVSRRLVSAVVTLALEALFVAARNDERPELQ